MVKLLFVCLGNICRSPAAEGVMKKVVKDHNLSSKYFIDSAGTASYHVGQQADSRMRKVGKARGYNFDSISRQVQKKDFNEFDYIFAMDDSNYYDLIDECPKEYQHKIHKISEFFVKMNSYSEVPDPYYGGERGFHTVIDILEDATANLLEKLENNEL